MSLFCDLLLITYSSMGYVINILIELFDILSLFLTFPPEFFEDFLKLFGDFLVAYNHSNRKIICHWDNRNPITVYLKIYLKLIYRIKIAILNLDFSVICYSVFIWTDYIGSFVYFLDFFSKFINKFWFFLTYIISSGKSENITRIFCCFKKYLLYSLYSFIKCNIR